MHDVTEIEGAPVGRRIVLGMLGLGAAGVLWGAKASSVVEWVLAPLTAADRTGIGSLFPAAGGFRIYSVVGFLPRRTEAEYRLKVTGLVDRPLTLSAAELRALPATRMTMDFQCVTGWRVP